MTFDRSGLWLMHEQGTVRVGDVAPASAGERAGVRVGDRIVSIEGVSTATRSLSDSRRASCEAPADRVIAMDLIRDDEAMTVERVAADRLPARWTPKLVLHRREFLLDRLESDGHSRAIRPPSP